MKKSYILLALLFLCSCSINKPLNNVVNNFSTSNNQQKEEKIDKEIIVYKDALNKLNLTWCNQLTWDLRYDCKYSILISLWKIQTLNDCNKFTWTNIFAQCKKYIYNKNYECKKLPSLTEQKVCLDNKYYDKAIKDLNPYWCLYIENLDKKKNCELNIKKKKKTIKLSNSQKSNSSCTLKTANMNCQKDDIACNINKLLAEFSITPSFKEKENICKKLDTLDKIKSNYCWEQYYYQKALNNLDTSLCSAIEDNNLKNRCEQETLYQKAVEMTQLDLCKKLKDINKQKECNDKVILRIITRDHIKDKSVCDKINLQEYKVKCYDIIIKNM